MSELDLPPRQSADDHCFSEGDFLRSRLMFLAILTPAIAGVADTNMSHQPLVGFWEVLAIATGIVCVVMEWGELDDKQVRLRLMWTQALHWGAVLVAMNAMLPSGVQRLLPAAVHESRAPDTAAAGHVSRRAQSSAATNPFSRPNYDSGSSDDLVGQAIRLFLILVVVFLVGVAMTF
jgi:hypothetical protein